MAEATGLKVLRKKGGRICDFFTLNYGILFDFEVYGCKNYDYQVSGVTTGTISYYFRKPQYIVYTGVKRIVQLKNLF